MDKWDKKTVQLQHLMDSAQWLDALGTVPHSIFTLNRNDNPTGSGHCNRPRYDLSFTGQNMVEFWRNLWLVEANVTGQVPNVPDLPEYSDPNDEYWTQILQPIAAQLRAVNTPYPHLQGYLPIFNSSGTIAVDRVRMMYLDQVILKSNGQRDDLVMVVLAYADVSSTREDGAASGPPH